MLSIMLEIQVAKKQFIKVTIMFLWKKKYYKGVYFIKWDSLSLMLFSPAIEMAAELLFTISIASSQIPSINLTQVAPMQGLREEQNW